MEWEGCGYGCGWNGYGTAIVVLGGVGGHAMRMAERMGWDGIGWDGWHEIVWADGWMDGWNVEWKEGEISTRHIRVFAHIQQSRGAWFRPGRLQTA